MYWYLLFKIINVYFQKLTQHDYWKRYEVILLTKLPLFILNLCQKMYCFLIKRTILVIYCINYLFYSSYEIEIKNFRLIIRLFLFNYFNINVLQICFIYFTCKFYNLYCIFIFKTIFYLLTAYLFSITGFILYTSYKLCQCLI